MMRSTANRFPMGRHLCPLLPVIAVLLTACIVLAGPAEVSGPAAVAQTAPSSAQAVLDAASGSVLRLCGTIELDHPDGEGCEKYDVDCLVTVVDPTGIAIAASWYFDYHRSDRAQVLSSSLKLHRPDGTDVPMRIVISDNDLGFKVLVPESPVDPKSALFKHIPLDPTVKADVLSPVLVLRRYNKVFNYQPFICTARINAHDPKPRLTYIIKNSDDNNFGAPIFTRAGRLVGIFTEWESAASVAEICDLVAQARRLIAAAKGGK